MNITEFAMFKIMAGKGGGGGADDSIVGTWVFNERLTSAITDIDSQEKFNKLFDEGYHFSVKGYAIYPEGQIPIETIQCVYFAQYYEMDEFIYNAGRIEVAEQNDAIGYNSDDGWIGSREIVITEQPAPEVATWLKANATKVSGGSNEPESPAASEGLAFTLKDDGTYDLSGIGTCTDTNIVIPSMVDGISVTSINMTGNESVFEDNSSIESIVIPDSVTHLYSFCYRLPNLKSIFIPKSVVTLPSIGLSDDVPNLTYYCEAESKPEGWHDYWNLDGFTAIPVVWGYNPEQVSLR